MQEINDLSLNYCVSVIAHLAFASCRDATDRKGTGGSGAGRVARRTDTLVHELFTL